MNLIEKINKISEESKNQFKPDLKKYGRNFRAISESAILEVLNPLFSKYNIAYDILVIKTNLHLEKLKAGRDQSGNLIEKLLFVAEVVVRLMVYDMDSDKHFAFEGYGSGVDSGDKATGKALTSAVKYALFKGFRLQYSDDPDADASEDIEEVAEEAPAPAKKPEAKKEKKEKEPIATEAQLNFIKGLAVSCAISDEDFKAKYGFLPYDNNIPMRKAREIIDELKKLQDEKLPF